MEDLRTRRLELKQIAQARAKELATELVKLLMEIMTETAEHGEDLSVFRFSKDCCRYGAWKNGDVMKSAMSRLDKSGFPILLQEEITPAIGIAIYTIKDDGTFSKKSGRERKYSDVALIMLNNDDDSSSESE